LTPYQEFIYKSRYARWLDEENRRENWDETVTRYLNFIADKLYNEYKYDITDENQASLTNGATTLYGDLWNAIYNLEVMPSMRALMTAGKALDRDNVAGYNCSYLPVDDPKSFDEAMYILLCGTGVGFSVERQYVNKLPEVPDELFPSETVVVVSDSKAGWAKALRRGRRGRWGAPFCNDFSE
jgi:ribonucleoside-triphosphate reductase